ncbi:inosine/xanthosine triphosphatase [Paraglaciecola aquimarina]|uniref:Inosine/xanthosine triphosphatase n=1 Tax=Paraglaciecola aquimarina TaxID=1235557 RepID=A0ABU3SUN9_9ALTE|nr:inosine/xanthosine triphosphatase [Paraglaciecola aquimarina]MDU0353711.1 inosine/xanthosine triphosphatase [Paraglaciecola aquimarina]
MLKIVVGSTNPVKINAVKQAIIRVFNLDEVECMGLNAPSGVAEQPMTIEETKQGALNRVSYCQANEKANYYAAIEGGVDEFDYGPRTFAYIVISNGKHLSVSRSSMLPLPPAVYQALQQGEELGPLMDKLFNTQNVKQKQGAIGLLTNGQATRESNYTHACILAMAPFINLDLYTAN